MSNKTKGRLLIYALWFFAGSTLTNALWNIPSIWQHSAAIVTGLMILTVTLLITAIAIDDEEE